MSLMADQAQKDMGSGKYSEAFYAGKLKACEHFLRLAMPQATLLKTDVKAGKQSIMAISEEEF